VLLSAGFSTPPPKSHRAGGSGSAKEGRDYGSFRKRVLRREKLNPAALDDLIKCQVCGDDTLSINIQAAHILDLGQRDMLFQKLEEGVNDKDLVFPSSINDVQNGVLSCTECHPLFDSKDKHIRMDKTGLLLFDVYALKKNKYQKLKAAKAKVSFAALIDIHSSYPSSQYLDWALQQKKTGRSGVQKKLSLESDEPDDEDPTKKPASKKRRPAKKEDEEVEDEEAAPLPSKKQMTKKAASSKKKKK
jgi:hypothetical protein